MQAHSPLQLAALRNVSQKVAISVIVGVSVALLALLVLIIFGHGRAQIVPAWVALLPALNALLNATSAFLLTLAYRAVRRRDFSTHARYMLAALATSTLFLVSYIVYHSVHGDTKFTGHGAIRPVYFFVLITHVGLAAVVLPLVFSSFFFSLSGRFAPHKRVSRFTLPVWLYVSVTGVLVFALLKLS
jgi:putative membrane protein